jgi:hypothetical protein
MLKSGFGQDDVSEFSMCTKIKPYISIKIKFKFNHTLKIKENLRNIFKLVLIKNENVKTFRLRLEVGLERDMS